MPFLQRIFLNKNKEINNLRYGRNKDHSSDEDMEEDSSPKCNKSDEEDSSKSEDDE